MRKGSRIFLCLHPFICLLMIKRFRDGLKQELQMGFVVLQFKTVRDLLETALSLEKVMNQLQSRFGKRKELAFSLGKRNLSKKRKEAQNGQFKKKGGN